MALLVIWAIVCLTGCTRREDAFLEEITSDSEEIEDIEGTEGMGNADGTETAGEKQPEEKQPEEKQPEENTILPAAQISQTIFVDICGAVANPGVYELDEGSRIFQAVDAAGGYLPEAAQNYLNKARSLMDGQQIYVPTEEEIAEHLEAIAAKAPEALQGSESQDAGNVERPESSTAEESGSDLVINLNTADTSQLCTLSGIGQSKAEAIIAYREEHGGFTSVEEIMNVEGIKEGTFSKIKDKISVG